MAFEALEFWVFLGFSGQVGVGASNVCQRLGFGGSKSFGCSGFGAVDSLGC